MTALSFRLNGARQGDRPAEDASDAPVTDAGGDPGTPASQAETRQMAAPRSAAHALTAEDGTRMNPLRQVYLNVRHAFREATEPSEGEGNWVARFLAAKPPSVNEQRTYSANKGWLVPGHEGGYADDIGTAYQKALGINGVALGNAVSLVFKRQFRFTWAMAVLFAVLFAACKLALRLPVVTSAVTAAALPAFLFAYLAVFAIALIRLRIRREVREEAAQQEAGEQE